jgi:hypothetical protein
MTDLEARLEGALKADDPPRDPMFRIRILERQERASLRRRALAAVARSLLAAILAALGLGVLEQLIGPGPARLAVVAAASVLLMALLIAPLVPLPVVSSVAGRWRARLDSRLWR